MRLGRVLAILSGIVFSGTFVLLSVLVAVGLAAYTALSAVDTPYQILLPGPVTDVQRVIAPYPKPIKGALYLTTIYSDPANVVEYAAIALYARFGGDAGIVPRDQARPRNVEEREYQRLLGRMMDESKTAAKVVALRELGYDVNIAGQGAQIQEVMKGSPAEGALQPGDIVIAAEGQPVATSSDLVSLIQAKKPGESVTLRVRRGDGERDVSFALGESPEEPGRARAGVIVLTHIYEYELPKELDLETRDIGGPSAGLMFALGIYNAFAETDITRGHKIAGTGSLLIDGRVGAVGGVKYKALAAQRAGVSLLLVPAENYDEAKANAGSVRVAPVRTFRDALDALSTLPPAG